MRLGLSSKTPWLVLALGLFAREAQAGILFYEDFDSVDGTAAWTLDSPWARTTIGPPHSGTYCLTDSPGGNYANGIEKSATKTAPVNLTNAQSPRLSYWVQYWSQSFQDYLYVETSINGINWTQQPSEYNGTQDSWKLFQVGLAGWAGQPTVYIRFRVKTSATISNDGWYIDDVTFDDGNKAVAITAPVAGNVFAGGSDHDITWTYDGTYAPLASSLSVKYSDDGFVYYTLASGLSPDTTSLPWVVPTGNVSAAYVRVELFDAYDSLLTQTTTPAFKIDSTIPGTFSLVSPANDACGSSTPTFDWGNASDANGVTYTLTVSPLGGPALEKSGLATSEATLSAGEALSSAGNPHSWTVTAIDPAGHSRTSSARSYEADSIPPETFALSGPADGTTSDGAGLVFEWDTTTDVGCGLSHYVLYVDDDVCADDLAPGVEAIALDATSCAPLSSGEHTWTVAAVDLAGNVAWSTASPGGTGGWALTMTGGPEPGGGGAGGEGGSSGDGGASGSSAGGVPSSDGGNGGEPPGAGGEAAAADGGAGGDTGTGAGGSDPTGAGGDAATGATGTGANGGTTAAGGRGGQSAGGAAAGSGANASSGDAEDAGGCGCRLPSRSAKGGVAGVLALLTALAFVRRRRASVSNEQRQR